MEGIEAIKERAAEIDFKCAAKEIYQLTGWFEFAIKFIATGTGILSLAIALIADATIRLDLFRSAQQFDTPRIIEICLIGVLTIFSVFVLVLRVLGGEMLTIVFYIAVVVGHAFITVTVIVSLDPSQYFFVFVFLNFLSEVIHILWIQIRSDEDVAMTGPFKKKTMRFISIILTVLYFLGVVLQAIQWIFFYDNYSSI